MPCNHTTIWLDLHATDQAQPHTSIGNPYFNWRSIWLYDKSKLSGSISRVCIPMRAPRSRKRICWLKEINTSKGGRKNDRDNYGNNDPESHGWYRWLVQSDARSCLWVLRIIVRFRDGVFVGVLEMFWSTHFVTGWIVLVINHWVEWMPVHESWAYGGWLFKFITSRIWLLSCEMVFSNGVIGHVAHWGYIPSNRWILYFNCTMSN